MYSFQFRIFYDSFVFVEKDETKKKTTNVRMTTGSLILLRLSIFYCAEHSTFMKKPEQISSSPFLPP